MVDLIPPRLIGKKPLSRSRALRRDSTESEKRLWSILQNRNLDGWKFRRQVAIDSYIVDFCCIGARLIVELDGEQHAESVKRHDDARTRRLVALGFGVLRFWNNEVLQGAGDVAEEIRAALQSGRRDDPQNPHLPAPKGPASSPVK